MPTYEVTLRDKTSGTKFTTKTVAPSSKDIPVDLSRYEIVSVLMKSEAVTLGPFDGPKTVVSTTPAGTIAHLPHGATATSLGGSPDASTHAVLVSIAQRLERMHRRKTGVISIMLGTFLGLCLFALTALIIALALGRSL